jgi:hypothetical protein
MPIAYDRSGSHELKVGDSVIIPAHVTAITSASEIIVESDEVNFPTSTTAKKELTVTPRIVKHD